MLLGRRTHFVYCRLHSVSLGNSGLKEKEKKNIPKCHIGLGLCRTHLVLDFTRLMLNHYCEKFYTDDSLTLLFCKSNCSNKKEIVI